MFEHFVPQADRVARADEARLETRDVRPRSMLKLAIGIFVVLAVLNFAVVWIFDRLSARPESAITPPNVTAVVAPDPPLLQTTSGKQFNAMQTRDLESYGWVDRPHRIVHVPIQLAMQMLLKQATGEGGLR